MAYYNNFSGNAANYQYEGAQEGSSFQSVLARRMIFGAQGSPFLGEEEDVVDFERRRLRALNFARIQRSQFQNNALMRNLGLNTSGMGTAGDVIGLPNSPVWKAMSPFTGGNIQRAQMGLYANLTGTTNASFGSSMYGKDVSVDQTDALMRGFQAAMFKATTQSEDAASFARRRQQFLQSDMTRSGFGPTSGTLFKAILGNTQDGPAQGSSGAAQAQHQTALEQLNNGLLDFHKSKEGRAFASKSHAYDQTMAVMRGGDWGDISKNFSQMNDFDDRSDSGVVNITNQGSREKQLFKELQDAVRKAEGGDSRFTRDSSQMDLSSLSTHMKFKAETQDTKEVMKKLQEFSAARGGVETSVFGQLPLIGKKLSGMSDDDAKQERIKFLRSDPAAMQQIRAMASTAGMTEQDFLDKHYNVDVARMASRAEANRIQHENRQNAQTKLTRDIHKTRGFKIEEITEAFSAGADSRLLGDGARLDETTAEKFATNATKTLSQLRGVFGRNKSGAELVKNLSDLLGPGSVDLMKSGDLNTDNVNKMLTKLKALSVLAGTTAAALVGFIQDVQARVDNNPQLRGLNGISVSNIALTSAHQAVQATNSMTSSEVRAMGGAERIKSELADFKLRTLDSRGARMASQLFQMAGSSETKRKELAEAFGKEQIDFNSPTGWAKIQAIAKKFGISENQLNLGTLDEATVAHGRRYSEFSNVSDKIAESAIESDISGGRYGNDVRSAVQALGSFNGSDEEQDARVRDIENMTIKMQLTEDTRTALRAHLSSKTKKGQQQKKAHEENLARETRYQEGQEEFNYEMYDPTGVMGQAITEAYKEGGRGTAHVIEQATNIMSGRLRHMGYSAKDIERAQSDFQKNSEVIGRHEAQLDNEGARAQFSKDFFDANTVTADSWLAGIESDNTVINGGGLAGPIAKEAYEVAKSRQQARKKKLSELGLTESELKQALKSGALKGKQGEDLTKTLLGEAARAGVSKSMNRKSFDMMSKGLGPDGVFETARSNSPDTLFDNLGRVSTDLKDMDKLSLEYNNDDTSAARKKEIEVEMNQLHGRNSTYLDKAGLGSWKEVLAAKGSATAKIRSKSGLFAEFEKHNKDFTSAADPNSASDKLADAIKNSGIGGQLGDLVKALTNL